MDKPAGKNTLLVASIQNGTIIDHITAGRALKIVNLLLPSVNKNEMSIGLNLPSTKMITKDIIKIHNRELSEEEVNQVAILSTHATISIIRNSEIVKKIKVKIPELIQIPSLRCLNPTCITNYEPMVTSFQVIRERDDIRLHCKYCEKTFSQFEIREGSLK